MADITAATYLTHSESRLWEAGRRCQSAIANGYAANLGELAIVASLTWDGAIDLLSALATLDGHTESVFRASCRGTASLLTLLNGRLPAPLQLPESCFNWLAVI